MADSVDLFGKVASDLQENINIEDGAITGTSKAVTGYTGFSSNPAEQEGNYIVLHFEDEDGHASYLTAELVGGTSGPVKLDEDGLIVFRLNAPAALTDIEVKAYNADDELMGSKSFDISGLTLA